MSYRSCRHLVGAVLVLLSPIGALAQEPETLPCAPDCRGANLAGADLANLNLNRVNLVNADLTDATLTGVSLVGADLTR